jgi:integrase
MRKIGQRVVRDQKTAVSFRNWSTARRNGTARAAGENRYAASDKVGFEHTTPLDAEAVSALAAHRKRSTTIGDCWLFSSDEDPSKPRPRITFGKWWMQAEKLAKLERVKGRGYHSLRRQFATELKDTPLRDLAYLGGWKDTTTLLKCYQQPDEGTSRRKLKVGGLE